VYGRLSVNPANPTGPGILGPPVAGAVVSTSMDSATAVTGGDGRFHLVTQTRRPAPCHRYTLTITAGGWPTWSGFEDFDNGTSGGELSFTLTPPQAPALPFTNGPCG
jgi:hypothetical protein